MKSLDKHEILIIRACKQFNDFNKARKRFKRIYNMSRGLRRGCCQPYELDLLEYLLDICIKIRGDQLSRKDLLRYIMSETPSIHQTETSMGEIIGRALFSFIRYTPAVLIEGYVTPLWFTRYTKLNTKY
jgi:hypothetical protein